jgi:phage major head subunit gpT-like protein
MQHYTELIVTLMVGGFTSTCYDGQYFFDEDHPVAGNSVSNTGTAPLSAEAYTAAYAAMQSFYDDAGKPLGVRPTHLVVPPQLRAEALKILKAETIDGTTNINRDSAELLVLPELAGHPKKWFLLDCSRPVKPFILQIVKPPEFVALDHPDDENVFKRREFLYGVDAIDNAGYGLWQLAWGSTGEGA